MPTKMNNFMFKLLNAIRYSEKIRGAIIITLIQHFAADFPQKVSLKILKTFTHALMHK